MKCDFHLLLCSGRMTVELRHLRCFLAIADTLSVTRAAERLHLSQPAVSRALRQLEQETGARLADRSTHHLELTPEGRAFRVRAEAAVTAFDDALAHTRPTPRPLLLGHAWSAAGPYTTPLLRRWHERHPGTPLELRRIDDRTAGLLRGDVDAALLRGELRDEGLVADRLGTEPRVAALPADDPLARRRSLTLADLAGRTLALNTVSGVTTPDLWPADARPAATVPITNTDDWLAAIAAGRCFGVTSSATAEVHPHHGVRYVPLRGAPPVTVRLVRRAGPGHPAAPDLVALAHEVFSEAL